MTTAERAAARLLPGLPARQRAAPGQFAFADRRRVERMLEESGWVAMDTRLIDAPCIVPESDLTCCPTPLGPVGRFLEAVDERTRIDVTEAVRAAL
jgi:hypothetical protein